MSIITPKFRVSYANVFEARLNDMSGKMEYSLVALFPKNADLTQLKKAIHKTMLEKHGADKTKWPKKWKNPLRDQGEKADEETGKMPEGLVKGAFFLNLKSKIRPGVVDGDLNKIIDETEFYSGCYAMASVNPFYYDQKGNKGVSFGLVNVQKVDDGEPLSGRTTPEQDFKPIERGEDDISDEDDDDINS